MPTEQNIFGSFVHGDVKTYVDLKVNSGWDLLFGNLLRFVMKT